jgi:hypothetical protein
MLWISRRESLFVLDGEYSFFGRGPFLNLQPANTVFEIRRREANDNLEILAGIPDMESIGVGTDTKKASKVHRLKKWEKV